MGLDMYLNRKTYVMNWDHHPPERRWEISATRGGQPFGFENVCYIEEQVGYWRKANAIHRWFVEHVQNGEDDCREYYVYEETLRELLEVCLDVLQEPEAASDLLPSQDGFFFGSTGYDEYYFEDVRRTVEIIEKVLKTTNFDIQTLEYHSSW
jgi:hypothetical protein